MNQAKTKIGVIFVLVIITIFISAVVIAGKGDNGKNKPFKLPPGAVQVSENVFSLGTATDVDGRTVEGFAIIDRRKGFGHKPNHGDKPGGGKKDNGGSTCFSFLAKGAKWKSVEDYLVDPTNNAGLSPAFIRINLASDINEWENAADGEILGDENLNGIVNRETIGDLNGQNEVIFADISNSGAIAVTIVWGVFSGPPKFRYLAEWDMVFDDFDFEWSSLGQAGKMDFENIAQHELGHSVGMGHPTSECTDETMYAFASLGETKKRTLNAGDITGVNKLY